MDGPARGRLTRNIPPATRRAVLHRDGLRCVVPGCRCRLWLDVHHLRARASGGTHDEANLVTLCSQHHRLVHDGVLGLERVAGGGIEVRHADGRCVVAGEIRMESHMRPERDLSSGNVA